MIKRKIIMDCDPGVDDAIAMAYAAANPDAFEIMAVTTVSGNNEVEMMTRNALDLTEFYDLDVPVAMGMDKPMVRTPQYADDFHGENGLGNCQLPRSAKTIEKENAVLYIRKALLALPEGEQGTLIVTGPMTNIGVLLKTFPEIKEKIQEIIFMGGSSAGGNVTPAAEFNIYTDPEAAKIVFESGVPVIMCGLDATMKCSLTRRQLLKMSQSNNPVAKLCGDMAGYTLENTSEKYRGCASIHDVVPLMYLTNPDIFTIQKGILDVDCSDGISRGSTICDFRWWEHEEEEMTTLVLMDADTEKFQEILISTLYEFGEKLRKKESAS